MQTIETIFGETLGDNDFHRPALFYSLFFAVYSLQFGSKETNSSRRTLNRGRWEVLRAALERLSELIDSEEPPAKYARFVAACQRQTDNIQPRRIRHQTLIQEFRAPA